METPEKNELPVNETDAKTLEELGLPATATEEEITKAIQKRINDIMGKD